MLRIFSNSNLVKLGQNSISQLGFPGFISKSGQASSNSEIKPVKPSSRKINAFKEMLCDLGFPETYMKPAYET